MLICKYEYCALAYQILRKLLVALYLEGKETIGFKALFNDEQILGLLEEAKGYIKYIRRIRSNIRDREPLWCCCAGSAAASFIVESVGFQRFGEKNEVYERATKIYEKGINPLPQDAIV